MTGNSTLSNKGLMKDSFKTTNILVSIKTNILVLHECNVRRYKSCKLIHHKHKLPKKKKKKKSFMCSAKKKSKSSHVMCTCIIQRSVSLMASRVWHPYIRSFGCTKTQHIYIVCQSFTPKFAHLTRNSSLFSCKRRAKN